MSLFLNLTNAMFVIIQDTSIRMSRSPSLGANKWSEEEDEKLKKIVLEAVQLKWKNVTKEFHLNPSFPRRTSKECHRRWVNFLDPTINSKKWTPQEESIFLQAHLQHGNQWALIEKKLPGRPNLCIKNHFYTMMRKGLRKVNKYIKDHYAPTIIRQLSHRFISKVVLLSCHDSVDPYTAQVAISIKKEMFLEACSSDTSSEVRLSNIVTLIQQLNKQTRRQTRNNVLALERKQSEQKMECPKTVENQIEVFAEPAANSKQNSVVDFPCIVYYPSFSNSYCNPIDITGNYMQMNNFQMSQPTIFQMPYQYIIQNTITQDRYS